MTFPLPSLGTPNGKKEGKGSCRKFYRYRESKLLEYNIDYVHLTTMVKIVHNYSYNMKINVYYDGET